jgi:hypothetical protein
MPTLLLHKLGVLRDNGGHAVAMKYTMDSVYGMKPGDVFWAARYFLLLSFLRISSSIGLAKNSYHLFLCFTYHLLFVFFASLLLLLVLIFPLLFRFLTFSLLLPLFPLVM